MDKDLLDKKAEYFSKICRDIDKEEEAVVKDTAIKLLAGIASKVDAKDIDNYIDNAIIIAYKFENEWSEKWERLRRNEQNAE